VTVIGAAAQLVSLIKSVAGLVRDLAPLLRRGLETLSRQSVEFSRTSQAEGVPFRDEWKAVLIELSNRRKASVEELAVTIEFRYGKAVFEELRVPFLRLDPDRGAYSRVAEVTRLKAGESVCVPITFYKNVRPGRNAYYLPHWPNPSEPFEKGEWSCVMRVWSHGRVIREQKLMGTVKDWHLEFQA